MTKKKILTIINSANMGGVEKTLLSCIKNMPVNEIEMTILCFQRGGSLEKDFQDLGVKFLYIKKTGSILLDMIQVFFVIFKGNFDIVHSRFGFTSGGFVLASWLNRVPAFVSVHSTHPSTLKLFHRYPLLQKVLKAQLKLHKLLIGRFATKIIGHSKANLDLNFLKWQSNSKFEIIYNGVDFKELMNDDGESDDLEKFLLGDNVVFLHIGSFREPKNHLFLIDVFNSLKPKENNYKLILVGVGGLLEKVQQRTKDLEIEDYVFFAGYDKNVNKYFKVSHLFFLPSLTEGLANVLIEAQFMKIPLCVSNLAPLYESCYEYYQKFFFDPNNKEEAKQKLECLLIEMKGSNLSEFVLLAHDFVYEKFSIESMVKKLLNLYNE